MATYTSPVPAGETTASMYSTAASPPARLAVEALVEQDPGRIDPQDMMVILTALGDIDVTAEPADSATSGPPGAWSLRVHWLQHGPVSADTEVALPGVLTRIRGHFAERDRTPPARMELRGPDHDVLLIVSPDRASS